MATIKPTWNRDIEPRGGVIAVTWGPLTQATADVGDPIDLANYSDKTFQAFGTFGAAGAFLMEGSNDGTNWTALSNRQGTAMSLTAAAPMNTSQDRPRFVRPRNTAGDGTTSVTVIVMCHRADFGVVG